MEVDSDELLNGSGVTGDVADITPSFSFRLATAPAVPRSVIREAAPGATVLLAHHCIIPVTLRHAAHFIPGTTPRPGVRVLEAVAVELVAVIECMAIGCRLTCVDSNRKRSIAKIKCIR